ncbi:aminotransferase class V-fold PLP-dependent enzyme [Actinocrinis puniceicyclus]|uniref:Aminotransferase class V-fold PLP-dependent enzyme n=1 Tax=Actinocrinis puniceicyclus TaxID=977794 RepID=A0A8J8BAY6_9ACTN|nr:cysteine desulfurase/sulfurtransferase TusA family protein [Actinocrinis puniceicyclus]MBS2963457.1 aminotransferase class V-fold PLP-dependent enzyme [Actinocrinis puniceicyclus]
MSAAGTPVFLDAASGEPMDPVAREAYLAALEDGWADPDRLYREGRRARMLLDAAREAVAEVLRARPDETVFTTSGTAALHLAVAGLAQGRSRVSRRIVTSAVEHSAVLHAAEYTAARLGGEHVAVAVTRLGRLRVEEFAQALRGGAALACVQHANHEVGTVQPVEQAWEACLDAAGQPGGPVALLVDAAAALGRIPPPEHWSALCASARKWGGPAGVGVLAVRKGTRFAAAWPQDEREQGRAPGPVNVPAVLAAAAALRAREAERETVAARQRALVERIRAEVGRTVPDVEIVGDPERRLPHIVTFSCLYAAGEALLLELDRAGFSVSSGSSCTASTLTPSHVLEAMGVISHGNVRVSLPWRITDEEVDRFLAALPTTVARVRAEAPGGVREAGGQPSNGTGAAESRSGAGVPEAVGSGGAEPETVDALGRMCPIPVIELARRIARVPLGATIRVLADDPAARLDIPAWSELRRHSYLGETPVPERGESAVAYLVRREH